MPQGTACRVSPEATVLNQGRTLQPPRPRTEALRHLLTLELSEVPLPPCNSALQSGRRGTALIHPSSPNGAWPAVSSSNAENRPSPGPGLRGWPAAALRQVGASDSALGGRGASRGPGGTPGISSHKVPEVAAGTGAGAQKWKSRHVNKANRGGDAQEPGNSVELGNRHKLDESRRKAV